MKQELKEGIEEIKSKIGSDSLFIKRVPKNTLKRFKEIANSDDFSGDYGFLIKYLLDIHDGIISTGIEHLEAEVLALKDEIERIKLSAKKEEEKPVGTRLDGSGGQNGSTK